MKCTLPFEPCSSICVSGQTGSGKTRWVYRFLTHIRNMYSRDPPCQILYCYGIYQPLFDEMERTLKNFRSKQGLPSSEELEEFTADRRHKLIVIDDLMHRVVEDKEMELLFTQGTHHKYTAQLLLMVCRWRQTQILSILTLVSKPKVKILRICLYGELYGL